MKNSPNAAPGVTGSVFTAMSRPRCPRGSRHSPVRRSSRCSWNQRRLSAIVVPGRRGSPLVKRRIPIPAVWKSIVESTRSARIGTSRVGAMISCRAMDSHTFFSQRLRLHYVDWGNPTKPPLLLLHGGRDHCRNWDWAAAALRDDWHVLAPDLRGHGDSAWSTDGSYAIAGYIYDLAQLVHQQRLAPVTIVAHSLGGQIALRYAGLSPDTVARLVAIEGLGPSPVQLEKFKTRTIVERMDE